MRVQYEVAVNMSSLDLVAGELGITLDQATDAFEEFVSDPERQDALKTCAELTWQIAGTLKLIQVHGACLLADNMYQALKKSLAAGKPPNAKQAEALSTSFFVLPRYLESVSARKTDVALMLLPQINEIRMAHGEDVILEHQQLQLTVPRFSEDSGFTVKLTPVAADADTLKRVRHMYQVGLLGVLRNSQVALHLRLMSRALQRFCGFLQPGPAQRFWLLANAVVDCFVERKLTLNSTRMRSFGRLDKALRDIAADTSLLNQVPAMPEIERELYHLLSISGAEAGSTAGKFMNAAGIIPMTLLDSGIQADLQRMFGPGLDAMSSVIKELHGELRNAMDILEILMQSGRSDEEEVLPLQSILIQLSGVLKVLGLNTLADYSAHHGTLAAGMIGRDHAHAIKVMPQIADGILFIENSLSKLERNQLTPEELEDLTPDRQLAISSSSQLETSKLLVYKESEAGISLAKRAINAYVESEFDIGHIYNVATTLNTIRGAFQLLSMGRITQVLTAAVKFVNKFVERNDMHSPDRARPLLETLADALISVEYYLVELSRHQRADDELLSLAEESLAALGYKVKTAA